jgi:Golgi SNAP receptor complex protein 1
MDRWKDLERELEELLEKACTFFKISGSYKMNMSQLEEANEQLSKLANNPELLSPAMLRTIQRHREVCQDNARELRRTRVGLRPIVMTLVDNIPFRPMHRVHWTKRTS